MVVYDESSFLGFAVADLAERSLRTYLRGRHYFDHITVEGAAFAAQGDALIMENRNVFVVPGGNFAQPFVTLRPSRFGHIPGGNAFYMDVADDPSGNVDPTRHVPQHDDKQRTAVDAHGRWFH